MHTIARLHSFDHAARSVGLTKDEIEAIVDFLAENPDAGDEISGTGGCRKFRWRGRGKGKSGGYRTITFYSGRTMPVFLITVFSKGEKSNLTEGMREAERSDEADRSGVSEQSDGIEMRK